MTLHSRLNERLQIAKDNEATYTPAVIVRQQIASKALVMVVAPAAMGKSYIITQAVGMDDLFAQTVSFSTRDPRPGDSGNMRHIERSETGLNQLLDKIEHRLVVNYAVFPTTGMIYGTEPEDHPGMINVLATQSNAVEPLKKAGFDRTVTVGLITDPVTWHKWFNLRYPQPSDEKNARLREAKLSLEWLLAQSDIEWLINIENEAEAVAVELIRISKGGRSNANTLAVEHAHRILDHIVEALA